MSSPVLYLVSRSVRFFGARRNRERVVVLGTGVGARKLAAVVEAAAPPCSVVGFVAEGNGPAPALLSLTLPRPLLGNLSELKAIIDSVQPARIIVALSDPRRRPPIQALLECGACGVAIETSVQAYERLKGKLAIESMTPSYLLFSGLFCGSIRMRQRQEAIARAVSVAIALVGLIIAAPLILIVAALIKLDSPGPALFVQERIGLYRQDLQASQVPNDEGGQDRRRPSGHATTPIASPAWEDGFASFGSTSYSSSSTFFAAT